MAEKQDKKKKPGEKKKEHKRIKKFAKWLCISVVVAIPILVVFTNMLDDTVDKYETSRRIAVAKLDEKGLTDDVLMNQEELQRQVRYGVLKEALPMNNITQLLGQFEDQILDHFWLDSEMAVSTGYSTQMDMISATIQVNTVMEEQEIVDYVFGQYKELIGFNSNFDRLSLVLNNGQAKYEQSAMRMKLGYAPVKITPWYEESLATDDSLQSFLDTASFSGVNTGMIDAYSRGDMHYLRVQQDSTIAAESLLNDYFALYGVAYEFIDSNPEATVLLDVQVGDSSILMWVDAVRAMQFGSILSDLPELSKQGFILQYHNVYAEMGGPVKELLRSTYAQLTQ